MFVHRLRHRELPLPEEEPLLLYIRINCICMVEASGVERCAISPTSFIPVILSFLRFVILISLQESSQEIFSFDLKTEKWELLLNTGVHTYRHSAAVYHITKNR